MTKVEPYDMEMIQDFLDHLMWELRASHLENSHAAKTGRKGGTNPELVEQLAKHIRRRGRVLLIAQAFDESGASPEEVEDVIKAVMSSMTDVRQRQIDAFESLKGLFVEVSKASSMELNPGRGIPAHVLKVTDFLKGDKPAPPPFDPENN